MLNTLRFGIDLSGDQPDLQFRGKQLSDYDAILPRIGNSITYFGTAVVRQFEQMDVYTPNTADGISNSRDKLRASQILSRHEIAMPATTFVRDRADVIPAIERVGGAPVVIKLLEGTQGIGVILAPDIKVAEAIIETLQSTQAERADPALRQGEQGPRHPRARRRRPRRRGDAPGGAGRRVPLQRPPRRLGRGRSSSTRPSRRRPSAPRRSWACEVAGVDMLEGNDGPLVMEVNSSPGLEGIETATKLDVAGAIIDYIDNQVAFPQIDVRQRLSVSTGYGVAELARPRRRRHRRQDDRRVGPARERHHRAHAAPRRPGDPQPARRHRARGRGPAAVLRQARGDALDDPRAPQAPAARSRSCRSSPIHEQE